jgi:hypothetical protein
LSATSSEIWQLRSTVATLPIAGVIVDSSPNRTLSGSAILFDDNPSVQCVECGCEVWGDTPQEAIDKWNRRLGGAQNDLGPLIDIHGSREQVEAMRRSDADRMAEAALSVMEGATELRIALHPFLKQAIAEWWANHFCSIDDYPARAAARDGTKNAKAR